MRPGRAVIVGMCLGGLFCIRPAAGAGKLAREAYEYIRIEAQECQANLEKLYKALEQYAGANKGELPPGNNFEGLRKLGSFGVDFQCFRCSGSRVKRVRHNKDLSEAGNPFLYFGGMNLEQARQASPNIPLLADKPGGRHLNIVYVDGRRESINTPELKRKISNCREMIDALHQRYAYPPEVLEMLRLKAGAIDSGK